MRMDASLGKILAASTCGLALGCNKRFEGRRAGICLKFVGKNFGKRTRELFAKVQSVISDHFGPSILVLSNARYQRFFVCISPHDPHLFVNVAGVAGLSGDDARHASSRQQITQ